MTSKAIILFCVSFLICSVNSIAENRDSQYLSELKILGGDDLFPKQSEQSIHKNILEELDSMNKLISKYSLMIGSVLENPVFDELRFLETFSSFSKMNFLNKKLVTPEKAFQAFKVEFNANLSFIKTRVDELNQSQIVQSDFLEELQIFNENYQDLIDTLSSFEEDSVYIAVKSKTLELLNSNTILMLNGNKLNRVFKNVSLIK